MAFFLQFHAVAVVSSITGSIIAARQKFTVFILWLFLMFLRPVGSKRPEVERIILLMGLWLRGIKYEGWSALPYNVGEV